MLLWTVLCGIASSDALDSAARNSVRNPAKGWRKPRRWLLAGVWLIYPTSMLAQNAAATAPADLAYRNGYVYTVDATDSVQQSLAIRAGRIVYVGSDAGIAPFIGKHTRVVELRGRMLMPGLVDGHMHPLDGGLSLLKCNLNYERLTVERLQARIQACLNSSRNLEPDGWLEVVNWFQEAMLPAGTVATHQVLDDLNTKRPIIVRSSFGHTALINTRVILLAGISKNTPDPADGKIGRDTSGAPSGILEDAAQRLAARLIPPATSADNLKAARAALDAARRQGITTFLDAATKQPTLAAFAQVQRQEGLTARAHFALLIDPSEGPDPQKVVTRLLELRRRYDRVSDVEPVMTVRNVKLFLDGVISAPAMTGAMLEPYWAPANASSSAPWSASKDRGPNLYFPAPILKALLIAVARAGFEPHMHADGDRAVREGLDAAAALRGASPEADIRVAMAHDEIVDPADFARFHALNVVAVLSFQWEKRAPDTVDNLENYLGPKRFRWVEPAGFLAEAGARIAYGSDWPVDSLDEWFALKVGVTRMNSPAAGGEYAARLGEDKGLTRQQVMRAITMNSSYELHQDATGSLELGKLADVIVLDRNVMQVAADQIAATHVLQTVVGGRIVFSSIGEIDTPATRRSHQSGEAR